MHFCLLLTISDLYSRDFSWSPTDQKIAYWVPGKDSIPAKITIIEIPSRKEVCTKSRHDVSEVGHVIVMCMCTDFSCLFLSLSLLQCKLQWHKQGDYLCVKVDHWLTKTKKVKGHQRITRKIQALWGQSLDDGWAIHCHQTH